MPGSLQPQKTNKCHSLGATVWVNPDGSPKKGTGRQVRLAGIRNVRSAFVLYLILIEPRLAPKCAAKGGIYPVPFLLAWPPNLCWSQENQLWCGAIY
jgi:hypothetical protein